MTTLATPPAWAEQLLTFMLHARDRETVTGDLLEMYRDTQVPALGVDGADRWYIRQMLGFVWRAHAAWAALFSFGFLARQVLDVWSPVTDFGARSEASTYFGMSVLFLAGAYAAWRTRRIEAGLIAGFTVAAIAAVFSLGGTVVLLWVFHDPASRQAIDASGGLEEAILMPPFMVFPGSVLGLMGAFVGWLLSRRQRSVV